MNPVRAGMVMHPGDYRWSSYGTNAHGRTNALITPHPVYQSLADESAPRQHLYRESFRMHLDPDQLHAIREALSINLPKTFLILIAALLLAACVDKTPLSAEKMPYAGYWVGQDGSTIHIWAGTAAGTSGLRARRSRAGVPRSRVIT